MSEFKTFKDYLEAVTAGGEERPSGSYLVTQTITMLKPGRYWSIIRGIGKRTGWWALWGKGTTVTERREMIDL